MNQRVLAAGWAKPRSVVILTGAGISAESGLRTFRDAGGLWEGHRLEDVATPRAFRRDPSLVQRFYDARRAQLASVGPNAAHLALARLEAELAGEVLIVTQNVDDLHERAGSRNVLHMHGELLKALCTACGTRSPWGGALAGGPPCPSCGEHALRPDIVWFEETPYRMPEVIAAIASCDLFVAIGTSGTVHPAAGLVNLAHDALAKTVELNLVPSSVASSFGEVRTGRATVTVPAWTQELLDG